MLYIARDDNNNIIAWNKYLSLVRDEAVSMFQNSNNCNFRIYQVSDSCQVNFDKNSLSYQLNP